jgi:hypothetical protein
MTLTSNSLLVVLLKEFDPAIVEALLLDLLKFSGDGIDANGVGAPYPAPWSASRSCG